MTRYGIVIPTYNEAKFIGRTIESIARQQDHAGSLISSETYEIVVADSPGHDGTHEAVRAAADRFPGLRCTLISESARSMVTQRRTGINHLLGAANPVDYIVSADADTVFPPTWLTAVGDKLTPGTAMLSTAGYFETDLWRRCPTLTGRYTTEIGTIFFPEEIAEEQTRTGIVPLFTSQVFRDFGRPVSDCALVIASDLYVELGGFRPEYYDETEEREIPAVGWPFMFRAEFTGTEIGFLEHPPYETSARRLLHEPESLFSGSSYLGEIENFRSQNTDQYSWLDHFAERLDMQRLRRYVVKNYILQQCITRPNRITDNPDYFGDFAGTLMSTIRQWRRENTSPVAREVFSFADTLTDRFMSVVLSNILRWKIRVAEL